MVWGGVVWWVVVGLVVVVVFTLPGNSVQDVDQFSRSTSWSGTSAWACSGSCGLDVVLMVDFYKRIIVTVVLFLFSILTSSVKPRSPFPHHPWLG